jgi:dolichol-phosphate mannosyltransferase
MMETDMADRRKLSGDVSVVLPSYNEKENVIEIIERIKQAVGSRLLEIIIVDDNSPDLTWRIVEDFNDPQVRLIRRLDEKGLASAIQDGVKAAKGEVIAWLDCDLGLPPEDLPRLIAGLDTADVVIGSRYVAGGQDLRPFSRRASSIALNGLAMMLLSRKVRDYTSGFVATKKEVVNNIQWARKGFGEYFIEFAYLAIRKGYRVKEVGYVFKDRTKGESKSTENVGIFIKLGWQYGRKILSLVGKRP